MPPPPGANNSRSEHEVTSPPGARLPSGRFAAGDESFAAGSPPLPCRNLARSLLAAGDGLSAGSFATGDGSFAAGSPLLCRWNLAPRTRRWPTRWQLHHRELRLPPGMDDAGNDTLPRSPSGVTPRGLRHRTNHHGCLGSRGGRRPGRHSAVAERLVGLKVHQQVVADLKPTCSPRSRRRGAAGEEGAGHRGEGRSADERSD